MADRSRRVVVEAIPNRRVERSSVRSIVVLHCEAVYGSMKLYFAVEHPVGNVDAGEHHIVVGELHHTLQASVFE